MMTTKEIIELAIKLKGQTKGPSFLSDYVYIVMEQEDIIVKERIKQAKERYEKFRKNQN